jgi:hypothetical protein
MYRGPGVFRAACREPGPLMLVLVTKSTCPPLPPEAPAPKPSAPGKAGIWLSNSKITIQEVIAVRIIFFSIS